MAWETTAPPTTRQRWKKWLVWGGVAGGTVFLLVLLAPTLLSVLGVPRRIVRGAVADLVVGNVEIDTMRARWRGPQTIEGLKITDGAGDTVANVDVRVEGGLLGLLGGDPINATIRGAVEGRIREDNTLSWQDILAAGEDTAASPPADPAPMRSIKLEVERLAVRVHDDISGHTLDLTWRGNCAVVPGGRNRILLKGKDGDGGIVSIDVTATDLLDDRGALTPRDATLDATITIDQLPVLYTDIDSSIRSLTFTASSDDLARRVVLTLDADTTVRPNADAAPVASHLDGNFVLADPLADDGTPQFSPAALTGTLEGNDVPTGLLQPFVAGTGLDLKRDIGPTLDITASLPGGEGGFALDVQGTAITVRLAGTMDIQSKSATLAKSRVHGRVHPDLVRQLTKGLATPGPLTLDRPTPIAIDIERGGASLGGDTALTDLTLEGSVTLAEPVAVLAVRGDDTDVLATIETLTAGFRVAEEGVHLADVDVTARVTPAAAAIADIETDADASLTIHLEEVAVPAALRGDVMSGLVVAGHLDLTGPISAARRGDERVRPLGAIEHVRGDIRLADGVLHLGDAEIAFAPDPDLVRDAGFTVSAAPHATVTIDAVEVPGVLDDGIALDTLVADANLVVEGPFIFSAGGDEIATVQRLATDLAVAGGVLDLRDLTLQFAPAAALLARHAATRVDEPLAMTVAMEHGRMPLPDEDGRLPAAALALQAVITLDAPATLHALDEGGEAIGRVQSLSVTVATDRLADGVDLAVDGNLFDADLEVEQRLEQLTDRDGVLDWTQVLARGRVELNGLTAALASRFVPAHAHLLAAALDGPVDVTAELSTEAGRQRGRIEIDLDRRREGREVTVDVAEYRNRLEVTPGTMHLSLTPAMVKTLQGDREDAITLSTPVRSRAIVTAFSLEGDRRGGWSMPKAPITATFDATPITAGPIGGIDAFLVVRNLAGTLTAALAAPARLTLSATAALQTTDAAALGGIEIDVTYAIDEPNALPVGAAALADVDVAAWERLLGRPPETLTGIVGDRGRVDVSVRRVDEDYRMTLRPRLPRVEGQLDASVVGGVAEVQEGTLAVRVSPRTLEQWLAGASAAGADRLRVTQPLNLAIELKRLRVPVQPFDAAAAEIDVTCRGGPLVAMHPDGTRSEVRDVVAKVTATRLGDGAAVTVTGLAAVPGSPPGAIDAQVVLTNLVAPDGTPNLADATVDGSVNAESLPTVIVDALARFDALIAAALGSALDVKIDADAFSLSGGRFDADIRSTQGFVTCVASSREKTMLIRGDERMTARLAVTPLFRQKIARRVCPLFMDVLSNDPVNIVATEAKVPLDNDLRRLDADVHIEFGEVRFTSESPTMGAINKIVALLGSGSQVGAIEPTDIRIRKGVAHITDLKLVIADHPCTLNGTVDMVTNTLDMRLGVPAQIAKIAGVPGLSVLGDVVDLAIRGPSSSPTIEPVLSDVDPGKVIKDIFDIFGNQK